MSILNSPPPPLPEQLAADATTTTTTSAPRGDQKAVELVARATEIATTRELEVREQERQLEARRQSELAAARAEDERRRNEAWETTIWSISASGARMNAAVKIVGTAAVVGVILGGLAYLATKETEKKSRKEAA